MANRIPDFYQGQTQARSLRLLVNEALFGVFAALSPADSLPFRTRLSLFWPRIRQLLRVAAGGSSTTLTVVFGTISLLIPLFTAWLIKQGGAPFFKVAAAGSAVVAAVIAVTSITTYISLKRISPERYANTRLASEMISTVFTLLAADIHKCCRHFLLRSQPLHRINENILDQLKGISSPVAGGAPAKLQQLSAFIGKRLNRIQRQVNALAYHSRRSHSTLLRLFALKMEAADILGIPHRRLCDHLLQYSPAVHLARTSKYVKNWRDIVSFSLQPPTDEASFQRFLEILQQNTSIFRRVHSRIEIQNRMITFQDLHSFLHALSSPYSTSNAVLEYARALSYLASHGLQLTSARIHGAGSPSQLVPNISERFRFIHRKQRVHGGFDLHFLLIHAAERAEVDREAIEALRELDSGCNPFLTCRDDIVRVRSRLEGLSRLEHRISKLVTTNRVDICDQFTKSCWELLGDSGKTVIVTHGYSKTVREVIKQKLNDRHLLYVVRARDEDPIESMMLLEEIKEKEAFRGSERIGVCDIELLSEFLDRGSNVLILLGAELFNVNGEVLHPRGIARHLRRFREEATRRGAKVQVVVVAESYKQSGAQWLAVRSFYRDHVDRLDLYTPEEIDFIITNSGVVGGKLA